MPDWINEGIEEFTKRLKDFFALSIHEIPLIKRNKSNDLSRILEKEANTVLATIPLNAYPIALTIEGSTFSSEKLASKMQKLSEANAHLCFLIGGPEGLHPKIIAQCQEEWSLSTLTLPHAFARLLLLEALYRSCSILTNHPYHK